MDLSTQLQLRWDHLEVDPESKSGNWAIILVDSEADGWLELADVGRPFDGRHRGDEESRADVSVTQNHRSFVFVDRSVFESSVFSKSSEFVENILVVVDFANVVVVVDSRALLQKVDQFFVDEFKLFKSDLGGKSGRNFQDPRANPWSVVECRKSDRLDPTEVADFWPGDDFRRVLVVVGTNSPDFWNTENIFL